MNNIVTTAGHGCAEYLEPMFEPRLARPRCQIMVMRGRPDWDGKYNPASKHPSLTRRVMAVQSQLASDQGQHDADQNARGVIFGCNWTGNIRTRWPRDVAWTDYPVIGGPFHKPAGHTIQQMTPDSELPDYPIYADQDVLEAFAQAEVIVLTDLHLVGDDRLELGHSHADIAAALLLMSGRTTRPRCVAIWSMQAIPDGVEDYADALLDHAFERIERLRAWRRFAWSYGANFPALAGRAMERAMALPPGFEDIEFCSSERSHDTQPTPMDWRALAHPWALQILFALRRQARDGVPELEGYKPTTMPGVYHSKLSSRRQMEEPENLVRRFYWPGSGAKSPIDVTASDGKPMEDVEGSMGAYRTAALYLCRMGFVIETSDLERIAWPMGLKGRPCTHADYLSGCQRQERAGVLEQSVLEDRISRQGPLSHRAHVLLNLLPPELDDPDLMLRWRTRDGLPTQEDIPSMDRWLYRALRSLKRTSNELRAADIQGSLQFD